MRVGGSPVVVAQWQSTGGSSLVPRRGGGGEKAPGIHCLRMRLITMEFCDDRVRTYTYVSGDVINSPR